MAFQEYELVLLRRRPDAPQLEPEELEENSRAHREYLTGLREKGIIVANGPVLDDPDGTMTGMALYYTGSVEETRKLAEQDPAVVVGRLVPHVMRWRAPEGSLRLPGGAV